MSKTIVRSLLFALAGVFAMNLNAAVTWSSTSCAPTDWTPLADNLLFGLTGTINGSVAGSGYASSDPALMTDGSVPTTSGKDWIVGFQNGTTITWGFLAPKTIDSVRISCGYLAGVTYSGFKVSAVEVKTVDSDNWRKVNADVGGMNATAQADILSLTLSDDGGDALAESVVSLRVTFAAPPTGFANYCAEIEAVGSSSVSGPVIGSFGIVPAKTKATVSGSIADVGTDATACDVYFALNGAEAVMIAEGVTDAFEYHLAGLTAGTDYAYVLSVSNNASPAKGSVRSGGFTTLAADASTAFWTTGEGVPSDWTPLANNVLGNLTGTTSGTVSGYGGSVGLLTDGQVSGVTKQTCGLGNGMSVEWTFAAPKTLEKLRVTSCDIPDGRQYDDIKITDVFVKTTDSSDWVSLGCGAVNWKGSDGQGSMIYAVLEDVEAGCLAENVTALKLVSGTPNNVAQYYAEIEAVGASAAMGPVIGTIDITPAKTKAGVIGAITDVGTDATACYVYLSLDGAAAVKVAEGVTDAFECTVSNLTAGTTYAYEFIVSNNAATAKGSVRSGSFTTLAADAVTAVWTPESFMPEDWQPLADNVFAGVKGTMDSSHLPNGYGTNDLLVLTDGAVPSAVGKNWIVGIQPDSEIDWTLAVPVTLEQLRISSAYLADPHYSGVNIASVKVKCTGSDEWVEIPGSSSGKIVGDGSTKNIICATLADAESGLLAENVTAVKIVFGPAVNVNANYYCEIEAVGQGSPVQPKGVVIIFM